MSDNHGTTPAGVFSATDIERRMAEREAARAAEELRRREAQELPQKVVMAEFQQPPARTVEQLLPLVMQLISQAADRGQTEVQICRFPNTMCADRGRRRRAGSRLWRGGPRPAMNSGTTT